ncbi:hypothetical protein [Acinetobacter baumannii]|uniref:hypothetical protein n=1 Tax=Acinetobacter baumannii TaxID=470 RepID=UPI000DE7262C|nr:hypothetical protein [Acinetobacter baumannii]SSQ11630.1 Uncharacterised protein [Acinetobacter baumannii]SSQ41497.1 Uncharacterised protein [Acinetobacter baumannii]HCC8383752.1 hypothetical protein [Acinetobacter baumannii]
MDAHTENRLHALSAILATTTNESTKTEAVWVTAGNDDFKVAFDSNSGTETAVFSLSREQMKGLVHSALVLDYNLYE